MKLNFPNINYAWGSLIAEELVRCQVRYACIAPGSRSSPLSVSLARHAQIKTYVHFDERGLGFHAMGYAAAVHQPAVLVCTSGTAVANFLPAVIEASKKKLPLVIISADRPPELRQSGAVQTIDQPGIFGKYVVWQTDMPCPDFAIKPEFVLTTIDQAVSMAKRNKGVVHINCMLREPLTPESQSADWGDYCRGIMSWAKADSPFTTYVPSHNRLDSAELKTIAGRIDQLGNGIIVAGKVNDKDADMVVALAKKLQWPIWPDVASGMRLGQADEHIIHYYDQMLLAKSQQKMKIDGVIHLGGRMTSKRYYEFIARQNPKEYIMALNHPLRSDPNHQVSMRLETTAADFLKGVLPLLKQRAISKPLIAMIKANSRIDKNLDDLLAKDEGPLSEPMVARLISRHIQTDTGLYLSNSMPIRDMDMFADFKGPKVHVQGNRGASGIDGLIASSVGYAQGLKRPVTLVSGDLAMLHDLNSLAMLKDSLFPVIMVVLNNGGGGIFSFLPIAQQEDVFEKVFGTPHPFTFANAAAMFEINYHQPMNQTHFIQSYAKAQQSQTSTIIEVFTNRQDNVTLHKKVQGVLSQSS